MKKLCMMMLALCAAVSAASLCWTAYSKSASSRLISSIALSRLHLPPDLYKCGGKPFAFIESRRVCLHKIPFAPEWSSDLGALLHCTEKYGTI